MNQQLRHNEPGSPIYQQLYNNGLGQEDNELIQLVLVLPNEVLEGKKSKSTLRPLGPKIPFLFLYSYFPSPSSWIPNCVFITQSLFLSQNLKFKSTMLI